MLKFDLNISFRCTERNDQEKSCQPDLQLWFRPVEQVLTVRSTRLERIVAAAAVVAEVAAEDQEELVDRRLGVRIRKDLDHRHGTRRSDWWCWDQRRNPACLCHLKHCVSWFLCVVHCYLVKSSFMYVDLSSYNHQYWKCIKLWESSIMSDQVKS